MEKEAFLETCVVLSGLDKDSILKTILKEKYNKVRGKKTEFVIQDKHPTGLDLLLYNPSPDTFAEYAYSLCSLQYTKEDMVKHLLSIQFDAAVEFAARPRVRTRQSVKKRKSCTLIQSLSSAEDSEDSKEDVEMERKLPSKLNLFLRVDGKTPMIAMSEILHGFFPGHTLLRPGIYKNQHSFVLLVVDNGRYKNCWSSAGTQNKLTWYTSSDDADRSIFDEVTDPASVVHVVRKRNSEMRYMGKSHKTEDVEKEIGSCVMYVA